MIPPELAPALEKSTWVVCVTLVVLSVLKTVRWYFARKNGPNP